MGWFDDLKQNVEQSYANAAKDINTYVDSRLTDPVVKVGDIPKGNLNPMQLLEGLFGGPAQSQDSTPAPLRAIVSAPVAVKAGVSLGLIATVAVAAYFLLSSKKRRG